MLCPLAVRLSGDPSLTRASAAPRLPPPPTPPRRRRPLQGPVHTAMLVAREEGLAKLWSGATATTIRQGSNQMALFWGKALCDGAFFGKQDGDGMMLTPVQSATSGFVAACIGPILNNPFDVVKTRR